MFRTWLKDHRFSDFDFSAPLMPAACNREIWSSKYDQSVINIARTYLDFDWPVIKATDFMAFRHKGDRMQQENPHFLRRKALGSLVLAEILEYKGKFIPDIVNGIFAVCEETYWGLSAHWPTDKPGNIPDGQFPYTDLFAAETAAMLAWTEYMLYDVLYDFCPEIIERIEYELERRIIKPYLSHRDFWWMGYGHGVNNWNPWILSNILSVFLLAEKRPYLLNQALEKMFWEIQSFYEGYAPDGGCDEGANYWTVAGASLFEFIDQLYCATKGKIDFFTDEKIRNMGRFAYHIYIGNGYFVNYADGPAKMTASAISVIYQYGNRIGDQRLMSLAKELWNAEKSSEKKITREMKLRRGLNACFYEEEIRRCPDFEPERECVLPNLQVAVMRRGKWFVSAKGGHNEEGHNHNDVGNFIAYFDKKPVLIDAGVGVYTRKTFSAERYEIWSMQSSWHNCPEINGVAQHAGKAYAAGEFSLEETRINVEFSGAYPKKAGILQLNRRVIPEEEAVTLQDTYLFEKEKNQITEHLLTPLRAVIENDRFVLEDGYIVSAESSADMVLSIDEIDIRYDEKFLSSWNTDKLFRLNFHFSAKKDAQITIILRRIL